MSVNFKVPDIGSGIQKDYQQISKSIWLQTVGTEYDHVQYRLDGRLLRCNCAKQVRPIIAMSLRRPLKPDYALTIEPPTTQQNSVLRRRLFSL